MHLTYIHLANSVHPIYTYFNKFNKNVRKLRKAILKSYEANVNFKKLYYFNTYKNNCHVIVFS